MDLPSCEPVRPGGNVPGARYLRQIRLPEVGLTGQERLRRARVLVLGAGGLGAPVLQYLAAAGVGTLGLVDDDVVEETNLHRQVIHDLDSIGTSKVTSAAARVHAQAGAEVSIEEFPLRLTEDNAADLIGRFDLVVDGTDNFPTRYLVSDVAAQLNVPVVWGSILGFNAQVSVFWARPPQATAGYTLRDLFPTPPAPGTVPSCAEAGVFGALCGQAGSVMAMEAIKLIAEIGEPLYGRVMVIDALRARTDVIELRPGGAEARLTFAPKPAPELVQLPALEVDPTRHYLVDVREPFEFAAGHAAEADLVPLGQITAETAGGLVEELSRRAGGRATVIYCQRGVRARQAATLLAEAGLEQVFLLQGDYPGWSESGAPTEVGATREPLGVVHE